VDIMLGLTLFDLGMRQVGGGILQKILQVDMEDQEALCAYGQAALALGQVEDALKIYLRLVVAKSEDKKIRRLLANTIKAQDGVLLLGKHLEPSKSSASALAFLASVVKDHSGVDESIALYKQCITHAPDNASYALNLMHLYELHLKYEDAISTLADHCAHSPTASAGTLQLAELAALLPAGEELHAAIWSERCIGVRSDGADASAAFDSSVLADVPEGAGMDVEKEKKIANVKPAGTYNEAELDVLALAYTGVKVLYGAGMLRALPALIRLLEPCREVKDLHLTRVRNENAYYCCIAQLLQSIPAELPPYPALYVAGDSHSLSPAWRTVSYKGSNHLLVPRLVTGCKIWHLRDGSDFFPRANFDVAMKEIPNGAPVVFIFGEIDCREGLLVAVERMRYPSLEAGVAYTIKIYMEALRTLARERKFRIMVHPVPPVLNETRHIVKIFNAQLKTAVTKEPSLHYLDFFNEMLSPSGDALADGLALDGTHLHPRYVKLLEKALPA